jgi:hypothetical protein
VERQRGKDDGDALSQTRLGQSSGGFIKELVFGGVLMLAE